MNPNPRWGPVLSSQRERISPSIPASGSWASSSPPHGVRRQVSRLHLQRCCSVFEVLPFRGVLIAISNLTCVLGLSSFPPTNWGHRITRLGALCPALPWWLLCTGFCAPSSLAQVPPCFRILKRSCPFCQPRNALLTCF